jgi:proliferating cell nuclear antigen
MITFAIPALTLREFLRPLGVVTPEARLHIEPGRIRVSTVDPMNIAAMNITAKIMGGPAPGEAEAVGIDIKPILKVLGWIPTKAAPDPTLIITTGKAPRILEIGAFKGGEDPAITIEMRGPEEADIRKDPSPPTIELPSRIKVRGRFLARAVKGASLLSDRATFEVDPAIPALVITAGEDGENRIREEIPILTPEPDLKAARSIFSTEMMVAMGGILGAVDILTIEMGVDHPIRIAFPIHDHTGEVEYLQAPRIADEEIGKTQATEAKE